MTNKTTNRQRTRKLSPAEFRAIAVMHLHAQRTWHGEASIVGNRPALEALRDACSAALAGKPAHFSATASDGEGYTACVILRDESLDGDGWRGCRLPYADPMCGDQKGRL